MQPCRTLVKKVFMLCSGFMGCQVTFQSQRTPICMRDCVPKVQYCSTLYAKDAQDAHSSTNLHLAALFFLRGENT